MEYARMLGAAFLDEDRINSLQRLHVWFESNEIPAGDPCVMVCALFVQGESHSLWEKHFANLVKLPVGETRTLKIRAFEAALDECHAEITPRAPTKQTPAPCVDPYPHKVLRAQYLLLCQAMNR
jgi:hypothetical protein